MRGERTKPWRPKPSQQCGPTSFIVKEDSDGKQNHVTVGSLQQCTCHRRAQASAELCRHIVFVMVKVLKVQPENPLVWQLSLIDRELDEILRSRNSAASSNQDDSKRPDRQNKDDGVSRKAIARDDICPICYDDINGGDLAQLTWCHYGCGQNIHGKCMKFWMNHNTKTQAKELRCPMCRCEWGAFSWRAPPKRSTKGQSHNVGIHMGSKCHSCGTDPICGSRYQCSSCWKLDLCSACFKRGTHPEHEFLHFEQAGSRGVPASRSLFEVTCCKLGIPQQKVEGNCLITSASNASRSRIQATGKAAPTSVASGALCIGMQSLGNDVKPQAARLRTGRSYVANSGPQTLPRLQQTASHRTSSFASEPQMLAAEQAAPCGDLTLFGVKGGTQQVDDAGLERQPRKAWSRLEAARKWAAGQKSRPATEPHR